MSISAEINRINTSVAAAYSAAGSLGATLPATRNVDNLADTVRTISTGAELNFEIVGGTAPPNNPKENTLWVNTDTDITDWAFSATDPTGTEGMAWFITGTNALTPFNALKNNRITVYPLKCAQYISGTWVIKEAKMYLSGSWTDFWNGMLYEIGDEYELITGGFLKSYENNIGTRTFTKNSDSFYLKSAGTTSGGANFTVSTAKKINLSGFSTLFARIKHTNSKSTKFHLGVDTVNNIQTYHATCTFSQESDFEGIVSMDISSLSGEYFVLLGMSGGTWSNSGNCYVYDLYLT